MSAADSGRSQPCANPHFHALILEGGFDELGQFFFLPVHDTAPLSECLRRRTIALFLKRGLISEQFATTLLCWRLALQKLTYDQHGGKVLYHTSYYNPYFKQNTNLWSAPDFIA